MYLLHSFLFVWNYIEDQKCLIVQYSNTKIAVLEKINLLSKHFARRMRLKNINPNEVPHAWREEKKNLNTVPQLFIGQSLICLLLQCQSSLGVDLELSLFIVISNINSAICKRRFCTKVSHSSNCYFNLCAPSIDGYTSVQCSF